MSIIQVSDNPTFVINCVSSLHIELVYAINFHLILLKIITSFFSSLHDKYVILIFQFIIKIIKIITTNLSRPVHKFRKISITILSCKTTQFENY